MSALQCRICAAGAAKATTQDSQRLHVVKCLRCRHQYREEMLGEKLRDIDAEFDREMRARGFDPGQGENVALPRISPALSQKREQNQSSAGRIRGETDD